MVEGLPIRTRRSFLLGSAALVGFSARSPADPPLTGTANADLRPFDELLTTFIAGNKVPGAALAVARHGKLVYARGVSTADADRPTPVPPTALFRIASVSKPITAVAVLQLVERGKLGLDDSVLDRMRLKPPATFDERWKQITVRHCLQHTGGWDRDCSFDPIGRPLEIAKTLGTPLPATPEHVVRYMLAKPLDFDPGRRYAYSNLGYLVLGRIIEAVGGRPYEELVRKNVFAPLGVTAPRLGKALPADRPAAEVRYHAAKGAAGTGVYPAVAGKKVPLPDGGMNVEGFEAHGGWIASAVDLVRFATAFDDPARCPLLKAKSINEMYARPEGAAGTDEKGKPRAAYYACGWEVRPVGKAGKFNAWHTGYIPGSESLLVRRHDGLTWAVLFNANDTPAGKSLAAEIDGRLHTAADAVKSWPASDQFEELLRRG